ncbi:MAG: GGDEF domain-containing protein [Treponema sp.]|nr:GGDEF domain-containing protein [Treponema sp.]
MCILICALFVFNISPIYYYCVTLCAVILFIVCAVLVKPFGTWSIDVTNAIFAGFISLFFGWQIIKFRISSSSTVGKLEKERNKYQDQSTVDELTQLKNRRDFFQTFQRFLVNYRQSDNFLCVAILDIDFFKNYNDHYGHPQGDECLRALGKAFAGLKENMNIYSARIGGEEFALLWFEKEFSHAEIVADKVLQLVRDLNIKHEKSNIAPYVTISIGVHVIRCGSTSETQILYDLADKALYAAKSGGRNRVVISS